jgi:hypothetical protein
MIHRLLLAAAAGAMLVGCAGRVEEPVLSNFFHAARLRDRTALQKLGTVSFDPAVDGIITGFRITAVATSRDGARTRKDVSISAPVALLAGGVVHKELVVTIELEAGRWIVTAIRTAAPPGPAIPPS